VISQAPAGGATASAGSAVNLVVSTGPELDVPSQCVIEAQPTISLRKNKLEWKIQNVGTEPAVIERIGISWPSTTNGPLEKVKLDKNEIVKQDEAGPTADIIVFNGSVSNRTVNLGEARTIKFEFDHNVSTLPADYEIRITFEDGCEVFFD